MARQNAPRRTTFAAGEQSAAKGPAMLAGGEQGHSGDSDARRVMDAAMTERELLDAVVGCARSLGYLVYHTWRADHSPAGFPDLCIADGKHDRVIFVELKTEKGELSQAQFEWLGVLKWIAVQHDKAVQAFLWRPHHWTSGAIEAVLRGEER